MPRGHGHMMPDMDGYETIRKYSRGPRCSTLLILALTAKGNDGDREKCLDAGASDHISKAVNTDHLMSLMQVRLFR
jgi:CheY-like chemotaxis protein